MPIQSIPTTPVERLQKLKSFAPLHIPVQHDLVKRGFDILFSVVFITTFSPIFFCLALLVFATSPGPVFYKSKRLGRGGKIIECLKFRSMYKDAEERLIHLLDSNDKLREEWKLYQKLEQDPRITPIGRFLRRTSLDELPQFWNVLKGDLSVVGPRPPTLIGPPESFLQEIHLLYGNKVHNILSVRPGITGVWQTSGRSKIPFEERCLLEEKYALTRTFWLDLVLIMKTVPAVLFSRGAF